MPYSDPEKQREYQRRWIAQRRSEWLSVHGPCADCGSCVDLEIDHQDPSQKISHRIWSWSEERRNKELAKCIVLCAPCHDKKSAANGEHQRGSAHHRSKLTEQDAAQLRADRATGATYRALGDKYGIDYRTAWNVVNTGWKHL